MRRYDKGGEQFYDTISALQSRCAALTPTRRCTGWCACSMVVPTRATWPAAWCAWPVKTLAWPTRALRLALDAAEVYERLGSPEGELALAECVVYLAWPQVQRGFTRPTTRPRPG